MEKQIIAIGYDEKTYWHLPTGSGDYEKTAAVKLSDGEIETITAAINNIEEHDDKYYTLGSDEKKAFVVVIERNGSKYLKTNPDDDTDNNLLQLDTFPYKENALD